MIEYLSGIWRTRYFLWSLVSMDLRSRYHGSALGLGWALLNPILMTVVLSTVFCQLFNQDFRSFAPFLLSGLAFWNFLAAITSEGCLAFQRGEAYIRQHPAPLAIYPLRATLGVMIHLVITLLVCVTLVWGVHGLGNMCLISLPATLLILLIFGWSLAICMGIANVLVSDMQYLVPVGLQVLFYLTPVMYPPELLRQKGLRFVELNPLASFLELVGAPILEGVCPSLQAFATASATSLAIAAVATLGLVLMQRRLVFYL